MADRSNTTECPTCGATGDDCASADFDPPCPPPQTITEPDYEYELEYDRQTRRDRRGDMLESIMRDLRAAADGMCLTAIEIADRIRHNQR